MKSMTGYGSADRGSEGFMQTVEIRSVNHRFLDFRVKVPFRYRHLEKKIEEVIRERLTRGRVEVFVRYELAPGAEVPVEVNLPLVRAYRKAAKRICEEIDIEGDLDLKDLLGMREVLTTRESDEAVEEKEWESLRAAVVEAVTQLEAMREEEGRNIKKDLLARAALISDHVDRVESDVERARDEHKTRLVERIKALDENVKIDESRIQQEVVLLIDRSDVTEEIVRIRSHLEQLRNLCEHAAPCGKRLDFLVQEIFREANTIASKSADAAVSQVIVEVKNEIERIREQVQNVE